MLGTTVSVIGLFIYMLFLGKNWHEMIEIMFTKGKVFLFVVFVWLVGAFGEAALMYLKNKKL
jgi:hypothetical protein